MQYGQALQTMYPNICSTANCAGWPAIGLSNRLGEVSAGAAHRDWGCADLAN